MFTLRRSLLSLLFLGVIALTAHGFVVFADGGAGDGAAIAPSGMIIDRYCPDDNADCSCQSVETSPLVAKSLDSAGSGDTIFRPIRPIPCQPPVPLEIPLSYTGFHFLSR